MPVRMGTLKLFLSEYYPRITPAPHLRALAHACCAFFAAPARCQPGANPEKRASALCRQARSRPGQGAAERAANPAQTA